MYIKIAGFRDGPYEALTVEETFSHPSLTFGSRATGENSPQVIFFQGLADANVYLQALQSVRYSNYKGRPTVGERVVTATFYDGKTTNPVAVSHTILTVGIQNVSPVLSVSRTDTSYFNRYFPFKGPVSVVHPAEAYIIDSDSLAIERATLQLNNALNGAYEVLRVTYESPEKVSLPVVAEAQDLGLPFGTLWRGEVVPTITSTIVIAEVGFVGDVDVIVDIRHSFVGDLKIELEHEARRELLVLSPGGRVCRRDNLFRTTFDSDSSANVSLSKSATSPGVCQFQTQGLFTPDGDLTNFRGVPIEGEWRLLITDLLLENDNGRLVGWSLVIQPEESHRTVSSPPVVPPLLVSRERGYEERHTKEVVSDGRVTEVAVRVQLAIQFTAIQLYLPTLALIHPDGTRILLADGSESLCAIGNYSYLVFDDRATATDYRCSTLLSQQSSGSGSGTASGLLGGTGTSPTNSSQNGNMNEGLMPIFGSGSTSGSSSGSAVGSGSGIGTTEGMLLNYDDIINLNITLPMKESLADVLKPVGSLSSLRGKLAAGKWTIALSSNNVLESVLVGWSLRVAREPNIDPSYNSATSTLDLNGADSTENYQTVLRSIVYDNVAPAPDFSIPRYIDTVIFDGEAYSNVSQPSSRSYLTVHHIDIDLDPLNTTSASTPNYHVQLVEHGRSIPILDAQNALLRDEAFNFGAYQLTITLEGYQNFNEEGLLVNISVSPNLQATFRNDTASQQLVLTISALSNLQPIESFEAVMRTIEYYNSAEEFIGVNRTVEFIVRDTQMSSSFTSAVASATVLLVATNDIPVLILNSFFTRVGNITSVVEYEEGQGSILLTNTSALILTDNDHNYLESVSITIQNPQDGLSEILSANTNGTSIQQYYNTTTHTLWLTGMDSLQNYALVLGTVAYENTVHSPGMPGTEPRRVTFVPFDGTNEGDPTISLVTFASVNDPAFGDLNGDEDGTGYTTVFTEEEGPLALVSSNTTLFDVDDITLTFIEVQILNVLDGDSEVLSVMNITERTDPSQKIVTVTNLRPVTSYHPSTGVLTISGLDSVQEYQEVLKTLTYNNVADEPTPTTRNLEVILNDGHLSSAPLSITVEVVLVNDSPFFNSSVPPFQPEIYEDIPVDLNTGISIPEISYLISDDDVNATKGLAIVNLVYGNGVWEYTLNGVDWSPVAPNISLRYALTLDSVPGNRIRFVPDLDFNGRTSFTIVAWDGTDGLAGGEYTDAQSRSNTDPFSSEQVTITLTVNAVNDAPVLQAIPLDISRISEDNFNSTGDSVLSLLVLATDVDVPIPPGELGVAVIHAEQDSGVWQFTTDGGITWEGFGEISNSSALLLHSQPEEWNRIRFVPNANFNGAVSFQFLAWDLTRLPEEEVLNVTANETESGSSGSSGMGSSGMGSGVSSASGYSSTADFSGTFQSSTDLFPDAGTNTSELAPSAPPPYPSGTRYIVTTLSDPITGPFSINSTTATISVDAVNDSPVIQSGMVLQNITENTMVRLNHGTRVADIIGGYYNDVDTNPDMGLAVVGVDDRFGEWQYRCDSTLSDWQPFIGGMYYQQVIPRLPLPEMATLLLSTCWIRFLPSAHFNTELDTRGHPRPPTDTPYIVAHGWDNTGLTAGKSGSYGNDARYAAASDTNEYSNDAVQIFIDVISVNGAPILRLSNTTVTEYETVFYEDGPAVPVVGEQLSLTDSDHARLRDVTITIYGEFNESPFLDVDFGSTFSGDVITTTVTSTTQSGGSGLGMSSGSASGSGSGLGSGISSGDGVSSSLGVPGISSAPTLPPLHRIVEHVQNLSDPTPLQLYCAGLEDRREELLVTTSNVDLQNEVLSWCPFTLHIFADPTFAHDAPVEQFELALRTLEYNNRIEEPQGGYRTVTFVVSDNFGLSAPVNSSVFVQLINDPPQLDLNDFLPDVNNFVSYTEGQGALVLANSSAVRLIDHDDQYLQGVRVVLVESPDADHEILNATTDGTNITASYVNFTLYLSGNDTRDAYTQVIESVTYTNNYSNPGFPDERERRVYFYVSDGKDESIAAIAIISFTGVNNRPHLDVNGDASGMNYATIFTEEQGPVSIVDQSLILHDEDNSSLAFITVLILDPIDTPLEVLEVDTVMLRRVLEQNVNNHDKVVQITNLVPNMTYDDITGLLYITGLDSIDEYRLVLQTVTYNNLADEPFIGCRTIQFIVNDWELDSDPVNTTVCVRPFNDSPRFNTSVRVISPLILEDQFNNPGISVEDFAFDLVEDDDFPHHRGIAIIEVDSENGQWQFSLDGGSMWGDIPADTNITSAVLLRAELDNFVRFVPNRDFNGNASITFVAWDGHDGMPDGGVRVALSQSQTDPFSEESRTMVLRVVPVNDAPILNTSVQPQMTTIMEDDHESLGDDVARFLSAVLDDVDVNITQHEFGIAVIEADIANGFWQVSTSGGANWTNISVPTPESAVVLRSQPQGQNRIRFVPNENFNATTSFQFKIWDLNDTLPSGMLGVNTVVDSVTGTFSTAYTTAHLAIEPVNDSPVVIEGATLTTITEDVTTNPETSVDEILERVFTDIDGVGVGVAVVGVDRRHGDWYYTCDEGSSSRYIPFNGGRLEFDTELGFIGQIAPRDPNEFRATLLLARCHIRFVPETDFNTEYNLDGSQRPPSDTPFIRIRGWDTTSGSNMQTGVDTTSQPDDHTNAFSADIVYANISVTSANDVPVLLLSGSSSNYLATFVEPIPPRRTVIPVPVVSPGLTLTDVDNALLTSVSISFVLYDGSNEGLLIDTTGTTLNYTTDVVGGSYVLRIVPSGSSGGAPVEEFQTVLRTLRYQNSAEEPDPTERVIRFVVRDGIGIATPPVTSLAIELVNDPPELDLNANLTDTYTFVSYVEGQGPTRIVDPSITLVDHDNETLQFVRVTITLPPDMHHEVLGANATGTNITVVPGCNGSELVLQGPASVEDFTTVIATVTYENTFAEPGDPSDMSRTIEFIVNDGKNESIPSFVYLSFGTINNPPFLDVNGNSAGVDFATTFYEERGPVRAVSLDTMIEDIDNNSLAFIEVTITNPLDGDHEMLWVEDVTETDAPLDSRHITFWNYRAQQYYNTTSATLRITGLERVYEYQEVLKTLMYDNLADEPSNTTRLVHFVVSDGLLSRRGVYSRIDIVNINDSPYINSSVILFEPEISEDVPDLLNPGWSVEEITRGLILDDDDNSEEGIAIVAVDGENGYWEVTWDFSTEPPVGSSGSGVGSGTSTPDMLQPGSGAVMSGEEPPASGVGASGGDASSGNSDNTTSRGGFMSAVGSAISSAIGSAILESGSGLFGSGSGSGMGSGAAPIAPTAPPPKCMQTTPPTRPPPITPTFYATWYRLSPNTSFSQATVLRTNGPRSRIRFIPENDFSGRASFSFVAWDTTDSLEDGRLTNASSSSGIDAYSTQSVTLSVLVQPINDAPVLSNQAFNLTSILEDDTSSFGDDVGDLIHGVSDVDFSDTIFGIAVILADEENGTWQFSTDGGRRWTTMRDICPYNATLLSSEPYGANRIRFVPDRDFNGYVTFSFAAWDLTSGGVSGTMGIDTTVSDQVIGTFSTESTTATLFVEPVNDSPVLSAGARLSSIAEDTPLSENNGTSVTDIVSRSYRDVDEDAEIGVAVVGVDLRFGIWEWWCSDTQVWEKFIGDLQYGVIVPPTPRVEKATLLAGECRIRFLPNIDFNTFQDTNGDQRPSSDRPFITLRAWDNTGVSEGLVGRYGIDTTYNTNSITNEFSAETENASVEVISVNDLPVLEISSEGDGLSFTTRFTEEQPYVRIVQPDVLSLTDADHARLESLSAVLNNSLDPFAEMIGFEFTSSAPIQIDPNTSVALVTIGNNTEEIQLIYNIFGVDPSIPTSLTLTSTAGGRKATVEAYKTLVTYLVYRNRNPEPSNTSRVIQFYVDDSEDVNSLAHSKVQIELLNDNAPVLRNYLPYLEFVEGDLSLVSIVSENLTLTDSDHNEYFYMTNATVLLYPIPLSDAENVSVNLSAVPSEFNVTQNYDPATGGLLISGSAPVLVYESILQTLVYQNAIDEPEPGRRTVTLQVFDGDHSSNMQGVQVNVIVVNDQPPIVTTSNAPFVYTERTMPVAIGNGLNLSDPDSGGFFQVNVSLTITNAYDGDLEILNVTTFGAVSSQFDNSTLVLLGPASISDFQRTMSTLTYTNMAEEPAPATRVISVQAHDGVFTSEVEYIRVLIELVNDVPVVDLNGPELPGRDVIVNYIEGIGALAIASNATLTDNDHSYLLQATVVIVNPLDMPNEALAVSIADNTNLSSSTNLTGDDNTTNGANITAEFDADSAILVLSGNASLEDYQTVLRTLTYENTEANPGFPNTDPRMIQLVVFDGRNYSTPAEVFLTFQSVNDAPMLDLNGDAEGTNFTTVFTEEGSPVFLTDPQVMLFDIDNTSLAYVRISIQNLLDGESEVLRVSGNLSEQLDLALFSYQAGTLLIEGLGGRENFRAAIASVTYQNLADEPNFDPRVISFVASDGLIESRSYYTTVALTSVNDPPRLLITGGRRISPPSLTPAPTTSAPPTTPTTTEGPTTDMGSGGVGSGISGSGSGLLGSSLGSGSGIGRVSGSGMGPLQSGMGSGQLDPSNMTDGVLNDTSTGMERNQTDNGTGTGQPPTLGSGMASGMDSDVNDTSGDGNYTALYMENSPPVAIVDRSGVLVEDDDNAVLIRLEVILTGVRDPGFEAIFFDHTELSNELVARLFPTGFTGDSTTCRSGNNGSMLRTLIDLNTTLSILQWEEVIRSLKYCNLDNHPISGNRTVSFRIQDPALAWSETQTATIAVFAINDAPVCSTTMNIFTIDEDSSITIPVLGNCFDHEEDLTGTSIYIQMEPDIGTAVVDNATGSITYFTALNDYGTQEFTYQACDSEGLCSEPQSITIIINPVNDPPYPAGNLTLVLQEDTAEQVTLSQFFGDIEDDLIPNNPYPRVRNFTAGDSGSWALNVSNTIDFVAFPNFNGEDTLNLTVCDSSNACVVVTVNIVVTPVNDPPEIQIVYPDGQPPASIEEDTLLRVEILIRDVEDRAELNVSTVSVSNGTAVPDRSEITFSLELVTDIFMQSMHVNYTPNVNVFGNDSVTISATDSEGSSTQATINIMVLYVNDPPVFGITQLEVIEDQPRSWRLPVDLQITDPEEELHAASFSLVEQASLGNVTYIFNESYFGVTGMFPEYGILTYYPPEQFFSRNESDIVTFKLQACDTDPINTPLCQNATIHITVLSDNDPPVLPQVNLTVDEDGSTTVNLWNYTSDVEDGRPPVGNIRIVSPLPTRGMAYYNTVTGDLTYTPNLNQYGVDYVYYNACDSLNVCSPVRGVVEITILEVNDPPVALDFLHIAREDDFDLIGFYSNITDNETKTDILRLGIRTPDTGGSSYSDEWTTAIGGQLRVYHAHQIITYRPPPDYVGPDTFTYSICDVCDPRRNRELGRVDPELPCTRQLNENGGSVLKPGTDVYITCSEATVSIVVANVNDVPAVQDIAGMTDTESVFVFTPFEDSFVRNPANPAMYFYRNRGAAVYDSDDLQSYSAQQMGLNLTLYRLEAETDIDENSLVIKTSPLSGTTAVSSVDGRNRVTYTPQMGFSGYDQFQFEICDVRRGEDQPRCSEANARIWVTRPGPGIVSLVANGASDADKPGQDSDAKVSRGDTILFTFAEDTNMPPYGSTEQTLSTSDVDRLFVFDPPFIAADIVENGYVGRWTSPTQFLLTIVDEGYPQPFRITTNAGQRRLTEVVVGEWRVSVAPNTRSCGGFDSNGQPLPIDQYCLLSADTTTLHSTSTSPVLQGDFGLKLPEVANVIVRNIAVDDPVLEGNQNQALFQRSQIAIMLKQPLSYAQLAVYCEKDAADILDANRLGSRVDLTIVGCANLLNDGRDANVVYEENIRTVEALFSSGGRRRRDTAETDQDERNRVRRQDVTFSTAELPIVSEVILQVQLLSNPTVDPLTSPIQFVNLIRDSFNYDTLAQVIFETLGVLATKVMQHSNAAEPIVTTPYFYYEYDDNLTPEIVMVVADDPDDLDATYGTGDTITITFNRATSQPPVASKANLDLIFVFEPQLGADYTGSWLTPSELQITVVNLGRNVPLPSIGNFSLAFTPNYFHTNDTVTAVNTLVPTDTPWCIGINVCSRQTSTGVPARSIGICDENTLSCRAHQGWTTLDGDFGTGTPIVVDGFQFWWIIIAIVIVILIAIIIVVVYFMYRYYTHKAQRKEALRVVRRWKKDKFAPGKEAQKEEGPQPWVKPPDVSTMRDNPDPFETAFQKLPKVVPRPPTAMTDVENLPPIPPQQPPLFRPRTPARIQPSLPGLQSLPQRPGPLRSISTGGLPPQLVSEAVCVLVEQGVGNLVLVRG